MSSRKITKEENQSKARVTPEFTRGYEMLNDEQRHAVDNAMQPVIFCP